MNHKVTYLIILFVFSSIISNAQFRRSGRGVGLFKIGLNVSYLNPDLAYSQSARAGLQIGISPTIPVQQYIYVKPELSFSMKGGSASYDQSFYTGSVTYRINYFEFPVVIGFKPAKNIALELGGFGALRVGGNFSFQGTFFTGYGNFLPGDLNDFDCGLIGGLVLRGRVTNVGVRYYYGMADVASNEVINDFLGNATNHTIQLYFQPSPRRGSAKEKIIERRGL